MTPHFRALIRDSSFPARVREVDEKIEPIAMIEAEGPLAGSLDDLGRTVAIVGTRTAPRGAVEWTRTLSRTLASAGCCIVSGGAIGIDTAAHEGALAAGGRTIAVLAGGVDDMYPRDNEALFAEIRETGALVAIRERGARAMGAHFLHRNAVIAALADDVVMVSAPFKSGARTTIKRAHDLKRRVWVVPGAPWDPFAEGSLLELGRAGTSLLVRAEQILIALGVIQAQRPAKGSPTQRTRRRRSKGGPPSSRPPLPNLRRDPSLLSAGERDTLLALQRGPVSLDQLVLETSLDVGALRALLLTWIVEGVVREGPPGLFGLTSN